MEFYADGSCEISYGEESDPSHYHDEGTWKVDSEKTFSFMFKGNQFIMEINENGTEATIIEP